VIILVVPTSRYIEIITDQKAEAFQKPCDPMMVYITASKHTEMVGARPFNVKFELKLEVNGNQIAEFLRFSHAHLT